MTNEEYLQLLQLGTNSDELAQKIEMQKAQAKYLRSFGTPEARQSGRVTTAPHWMELVGRLAQEGVAAKQMREAQAGQQKMAQNRAEQNQMIMKALIAQQQLQNPQQSPAVGPGMNPASGGQGMQPPPNFQY